MPKLKHCFFAGAIIALLAGFFGPSSQVIFDLGLPLGAAFVGLFLIFHILEGESALFDRQNEAQRSARRQADRSGASGRTGAAVVQRSARAAVNQDAAARSQEPGRRAGAPAV